MDHLLFFCLDDFIFEPNLMEDRGCFTFINKYLNIIGALILCFWI